MGAMRILGQRLSGLKLPMRGGSPSGQAPAWLERDRVRVTLSSIILACLLVLIIVGGRSTHWTGWWPAAGLVKDYHR